MYEVAERLKLENPKFQDLVIAIGKFIHQHAKSVPNQRQPKSIIESRFTPAEEAFRVGMLSCGSISNISAAMLRHLGFKVKLVHGESKESVDHAWISVLNPENNEWKEYDLSRADGSIPNTHVKKGEVESWKEIRDQITKDHETLRKRRKERTEK